MEEIAPDVVWFPALWPETYSYTLSIALHLGLPVVVPDIGAFVERVQDRPHSAICPWNKSAAQWREFWLRVAQSGALPTAPAADPAADEICARRDAFYSGAYLQPVAAVAGELGAARLQSLAGNLHAGVATLNLREKLLGRIWRVSRSPLVAKMISVVPFRLQRAIKRRLSARPMHDIVRGE